MLCMNIVDACDDRSKFSKILTFTWKLWFYHRQQKCRVSFYGSDGLTSSILGKISAKTQRRIALVCLPFIQCGGRSNLPLPLGAAHWDWLRRINRRKAYGSYLHAHGHPHKEGEDSRWLGPSACTISWTKDSCGKVTNTCGHFSYF